MKKNWFYRLLLSYMPVFLAVCLTLLLITFVSVRQLTERSAAKSSEAVAHNSLQLIEQSLRTIENSMYQAVSADPRIAAFYSGRDGSFAGSYPAALALGELQNRLPLLHSIYLYRPEDDTVLVPTSIFQGSGFADRDYVAAKMESDSRFAWGDRRSLTFSPFAAPKDVISLAKIADLRTKGLLVATVDIGRLRELLRNSIDPSAAYLDMTDSGGATIVSTAESGAGGNMERRKLVAVEMPYTGWTINGGMLQPGIFGWVAPFLYGSVSIGLLSIAVGLIWIVHVTRRHYRPVEALLRQIGAFSAKKQTASAADGLRDEFQTIGLALDRLWDQSNRLSRENEENKRFKRAHQFRRLAEGRLDAHPREARREAEQLGLRLDAGSAAAIVEIDRFFAEVCRQYPDPDRQLLKYALQSAAQETMASAGFAASSEWLAEHRLGLIVSWDEELFPGQTFDAGLERFRVWVNRYLPFTVTIGTGVAVESAELVSRSFQTGKEALEYKVSLGLNRIIAYRDLPRNVQPEIAIELQRIKEISRAFRMGDPGWSDDWTRLLVFVNSGRLGAEQIRHLLFVLLFHVQREMIELPAELQSAWVSESAHLEDVLKEGETLQEIGAAFEAALESVGAKLGEWRDSKNNRSVVQEIKRYIDEHYADPNMSLATLNGRFGLHSTSISRLFKEEYGVKFVDYLNGVRLEQGKLLMEQSDIPVQEIAGRVGFVHSQTFIKLFKKHTGHTPGSYRKEKTGTG